MSYLGKHVSFQHRVATGHPVMKRTVSGISSPQPVPTELRTDDALVVSEEHVADGEPKLSLVYLAEHDNGVPTLENAQSIPHADHADAQHERFWRTPAPVTVPDPQAKKLHDFLMENFKKETGNETPVDCAIRLLGKLKKDK